MKRILLVDDSRVTRELIKVYLIAKDVELLEAIHRHLPPEQATP